jgi:hypothetical protein
LKAFVEKKRESSKVSQEWIENISPEELVSLNTSLSYMPVTLESSIRWSLKCFRQQFDENIRKLIEQHPRDELDEEGKLFWTG